MNITERINRILIIMSHVSQKQGIPVDELAAKVKMRPRQLLKELEFMLLIGKPPFRPDDYVDIYVENDRVYLEYDQMLNRPLRFTRPEAMALLISLQLLDSEVDPQVVTSLRRKIRKSISHSLDSAAQSEDRVLLERPSRIVAADFVKIRQAIEERQKIRIEYYALTRDRTTRRVVRPYFLMNKLGYWYLTGHCELRDDLRTFKFERILSVEPLREGFPVPRLDLDRYKESFLSSSGKVRARILFEPAVAPWVRERWGSAVTDAEGGRIVLELSSDTLEYPSRLVFGFAPHARPLSPPELIEKVRSDAREILEFYENEAVH